MQKLLCFILLAVFIGCAPVEKGEDSGQGGAYRLPDDEFRTSPNQQNPVYNVLSYFEKDNPHVVVERNFRKNTSGSAELVIFDYSFTAAQCDDTKSRAEHTLFVVSGSTVKKLEDLRPFHLGANDFLRVSVDNSVRCRSLYLRFAAVPN